MQCAVCFIFFIPFQHGTNFLPLSVFNHLFPMCLSDDAACHTTAACMARFGFLNFMRQDAACGWEHNFSSTLGTTWEFLKRRTRKTSWWHAVIYNFLYVRAIISLCENLKPQSASFAPTWCSFICCSETGEKHKQFWGLRLKISFISRRKCDPLVVMVGELRKPLTCRLCTAVINKGNISYITSLNLQVDGIGLRVALLGKNQRNQKAYLLF